MQKYAYHKRPIYVEDRRSYSNFTIDKKLSSYPESELTRVKNALNNLIYLELSQCLLSLMNNKETEDKEFVYPTLKDDQRWIDFALYDKNKNILLTIDYSSVKKKDEKTLHEYDEFQEKNFLNMDILAHLYKKYQVTSVDFSHKKLQVEYNLANSFWKHLFDYILEYWWENINHEDILAKLISEEPKYLEKLMYLASHISSGLKKTNPIKTTYYK